MLLRHAPSLLSFLAKSEEANGGTAPGNYVLPSAHAGTAHRGGPQGAAAGVSGMLSPPTAGTFQPHQPPAVLSLALRVLVPALYNRQLLPEDLMVLLQPLAQLPLLKQYVAAAIETAPQSPLALLPDAVGRVILQSSEAARDGVQ